MTLRRAIPASLRHVRFDVVDFLTTHGLSAAIDFSDAPAHYRQALRDFVRRGVVPARPLLTLLEGDVSAVRAFRDDLPGLLALSDWLHHQLLANCWGSRDQVQLWASSAQRSPETDPLEETP